MQVQTASGQTTANPQPVIIEDDLTIPPATTKTITAFVKAESVRPRDVWLKNFLLPPRNSKFPYTQKKF